MRPRQLRGEVGDEFALAARREAFDQFRGIGARRRLQRFAGAGGEEAVERAPPLGVIGRVEILGQDGDIAFRRIQHPAVGTAEAAPVHRAAPDITIAIEHAVAGPDRAVRHRAFRHQVLEHVFEVRREQRVVDVELPGEMIEVLRFVRAHGGYPEVLCGVQRVAPAISRAMVL